MFLCWSAKGGCGTTVVAASLALALSRLQPVLLVDLAGDVPAALGLTDPAGPGLFDWLASPTATGASLATLAVDATDSLRVVPQGTSSGGAAPAARWAALAATLTELQQRDGVAVVVDAGHHAPPEALATAAHHRLLVMRVCYLVIRRSARTVSPTGIVLVKEAGRALSARDLEDAVGAPVVVEVPWDPAVFRAVDAGILAGRLAPTLARPLGRFVTTAASTRGAA